MSGGGRGAPRRTVVMPHAVDAATVVDAVPGGFAFASPEDMETEAEALRLEAEAMALLAAYPDPETAHLVTPPPVSVVPSPAVTAEWMRETQAGLPRVDALAHTEPATVGRVTPGTAKARQRAVLEDGAVFLGRYQIETRIGAGGFGEVYRALDRSTGERVAIKVVGLHSLGREEVIARFESEALHLEKLRHIRQVVRILGHARDPDVGFYIVMELLAGDTLEALFLTNKTPVVEWLALLASVGEGMQPIHDRDIFHRDLKPANVFVEKGPDGSTRIVILDLGLAKTKGAPSVTSKSLILGTTQFMSPEHVGRGKICAASDQYSLAAMAYLVLEGLWVHHQQELENADANAVGKASWHLHNEIPLPHKIAVVIWNILARALEKDASLRYPSIYELSKQLRRVEADMRTGRLSKSDLLPAVDSDRARPAAPPIKRMDATPLPNLRPFLVDPGAILDVPSLKVVHGPDKLMGMRFGIGRDLVIGRALPIDLVSQQADLALSEGGVSRRHCRLQAMDEGFAACAYQVDDLGSTYGTIIDGAPQSEAIVHAGARIGLGPMVTVELLPPDVLAKGEAKGLVSAPKPAGEEDPRHEIRRRLHRAQRENRRPSVPPEELRRFLADEHANLVRLGLPIPKNPTLSDRAPTSKALVRAPKRSSRGFLYAAIAAGLVIALGLVVLQALGFFSGGSR